MKKKIICLITCFMLVIGSLFALIPVGTAKAETIKYEGSISSDSSVIPDYAVTSIEMFSYDTSCAFNLTLDTSKLSSNADILYFFLDSKFSGYVVNAQKFEMVFNPTYDTNSYFYSLANFTINSYESRLCVGKSDSTSIIYLPRNTGIYTFSIIFKINNCLSSDDYDLSSFVDMKANNDLFNTFCLKENTYFYDLYRFYTLNEIISSVSIANLNLRPTRMIYNVNGLDYDLLAYLSNLATITNWQYLKPVSTSVSNFYLSPTELNFSIYRPTERVNNTLVLYNFNYTFLKNVSYIEYTLRKNSGYYTVQSLSSIPNDYYIFLSSIEIQNKIFDEYITLELGGVFSSNSYQYYLDNIVVENNYIKIPFGFDFNFTYYNEPLVASNGIYNYDFQKPGYVSMNFSLSPFYIPVLEAVENIFIFLVFYCPIISDILELLHLDLFIGGLISIINYLLGLEIGQFIISCIAFIIFFAILKSFMPIVVSAGVGAVDNVKSMYYNSQHYYNKQQKKIRKAQRKAQLKQERYQKRVMRKALKRRKKGK